jgi:hypothetical protein
MNIQMNELHGIGIHDIIISKFREWLIVDYVINVVGGVLTSFYIFKGERLRDDYIKLCKPSICMVM